MTTFKLDRNSFEIPHNFWLLGLSQPQGTHRYIVDVLTCCIEFGALACGVLCQNKVEHAFCLIRIQNTIAAFNYLPHVGFMTFRVEQLSRSEASCEVEVFGRDAAF